MVTLSLSEQEIKVLKMSIAHCLKTCKEGSSANGCTDCQTLEQVSHKIDNINPNSAD